jgi:predicted RNase H-like HicB family nuclease
MEIQDKQLLMAFYRVEADGTPYTVKVEPDPEDGWYISEALAIPGCVTQGETIEEALEMAKGAIRLCLKHRKEADHAER